MPSRGFPKLRVLSGGLGVSIIRTIVYVGVPLFWETTECCGKAEQCQMRFRCLCVGSLSVGICFPYHIYDKNLIQETTTACFCSNNRIHRNNSVFEKWVVPKIRVPFWYP